MISINVLVPYEERIDIDVRQSDTFRIISSAKNRETLSRLFVIETTEEEATFLTLRYGKENVWKR